MLTRESNELMELEDSIFTSYCMESIAYFDIETTGFDKTEDSIVLLSLGVLDSEKKLSIKQYFAESIEDEKKILYSFLLDIQPYNTWCSYNGIAFDEPFIKSRMEKHNIILSIPKNHVDLFRIIRPYYKQLGMERCNLKGVEKHIGISREDQIDGGISVDLYKEFLSNGDEGIRDIIMLHNYEDVLSLPKIHEYIHNIENNKELKRDNVITKKQLSYLKSLLNTNDIALNINLERVSKKAASKTIDQILKGCKDCEELNFIISNSY